MGRADFTEPRYVAVEGVIGVGKTTLVNQLAPRLSARTVFEEFENNPFLPDFYRDKDAFAFSTQIFFLMSRFRQQERLAQQELFLRSTVSDYCFDKDRIFAVLTLSNEELNLYERLFEVLRTQVPKPDLVIHLHADHEVIMERIQRRGRPYEQDMDPGYIRELTQAYVDYFQSYREAPVLHIDTSSTDVRGSPAVLDGILQAIWHRRENLGLPTSADPTQLPLIYEPGKRG